MKPSSFKRRVVAAAVVILLGLFLLRPGVSRLKTRITNSISRAVARPADIGSVHLRFLPQPGFDLSNLVIYEDPAFGAEPMLRAPEVTAVVRLTSLMRGRLEISRLELSEPSLNLVRREDGRWNWEALLERTARTPLAPTAKPKSEARPGFPYIEANSGRINFKAGQEKKPYALLNADFALWQDSENAWGVRLKAEPLRTDMNLSDTGLLRMNGVWQRAGSLRETPLQFSLDWSKAQLGQMTKLASGNDKGWRGEVHLSATLGGTPAAMQVATDASIEDFRRYDIASSEGLRLAAHCDGKYNSAEGVVHEIFCSAPVGGGAITLHGDAGLPGVHTVDLTLNVENVPMTGVVQLARRAKKNLPTDLIPTGSVQGNFTVRELEASTRGLEFQGKGEIADLQLQSASNKVDISPGNVPFVLASDDANIHAASGKKTTAKALLSEVFPATNGLRVEYGPFPVALGSSAPAQVRGWIGRSGYGMVIRGDGQVSRTLRLASLLGLPALKATVEGAAQMSVEIAGSWTGNVSGASGFSAPEITGDVQLNNVRATVRGVNGPIEISSAVLHLLPDEARVDKLNARAADARWTGSVSLPRGCGTPGACVVHFNLNTESVGLSNLHAWMGSQPSERRWYQVLSSAGPAAPSFLQNLRASGKVSIGRLQIRNVSAERVTAALDLDRGKVKISDLRAELMGGKHLGEWQADFTVSPPIYTGSGTFTTVSLQQAADAMQDSWVSGTAGGSYRLSGAGASSAEFWQSAEGEVQFDLRDGVLPHVTLKNDDGPLRVVHWQGRARLHGGKIDLDKGKMISFVGAFEISGSVSLGRALDFKFSSGEGKSAVAAVYSITGTVGKPRVVSLTPEEQARLKQ
ncbi:MAG: AsmA family protein [Candidatus Sulfotelmatobacter sp.]